MKIITIIMFNNKNDNDDNNINNIDHNSNRPALSLEKQVILMRKQSILFPKTYEISQNQPEWIPIRSCSCCPGTCLTLNVVMAARRSSDILAISPA